MPDSLKRDFAILQKYAGSYKDENVFGFVNEFIFAQGYQGFIDVIGIYFTNSFQTGLGIKASRFNHSCCSNANAYWNEDEGVRLIRTVKDVKIDEEITIEYYNGMGNLKAKENFLSLNYGFKCKCELCINQ